MSDDKLPIEKSRYNLEQVEQTIFDGAQISGDVNIRDITQNNIVINQPEDSKPVGIPQNIPHRGVTKFVGRTEEMKILHHMLQGTDCVEISAIAGMGGVGKTELAIQYALTHQETYQAGICWLQAKEQDVGNQIIDFARAQLGLNPPDSLKTITQQLSWCWQRWQQGNALVVFDDVKDYTQVKPYLPPFGSRFRVLLTTRQRLLKSSERLELDVLALDAAIALIESLIGAERLQREIEVAKSLCQWLGCLPLGLELVGRYLARKQDLSLAEMKQRLNEKRLEQQALKKPKSESDMTAQLGVAAAIELSWTELSPAAQELAYFLGVLNLESIPWNLIEQCFPHQEQEELEEIRDDLLLDLHLIQNESKGAYKLHELIRQFLQTKLTELMQVADIKKAVTLRIAALAEYQPACIIKFLKDGLLDWNFVDDISQISAVELGWQLRTATEAWSIGIGQLANLVLHLRNNGSVPSLGVRVVDLSLTDPRTNITYKYDNYFQTGWYFGNQTLEDIVELPPEVETALAYDNPEIILESQDFFAAGWNYFRRASLNTKASWAWQWTFNIIRDALTELLKQRRLPVSAGLLSLEAAWHAALYLTNRRNYSYSNPIPLSEIEEILSRTNNFRFSKMLQHCLNQLRIEIEYLREQDEVNLSLPSCFQTFKNSQYISPEILLQYTEHVFRGAIESYFQVVNSLFPKFAPSLQLASIFPARLVGVVVVSSNSASVTWFWEPLPTGSQSCTEFKLGVNHLSEDDSRFQYAASQLRLLRPNSFKHLSIKIRSESELSKSWLGDNPVTELAYKWLWEDLKKVFYLEGEIGYAGFPYWR